MAQPQHKSQWRKVCNLAALVPDSGVAALLQGQQIALFYLPAEEPVIYALDNWDPIGQANVLSRGIVGDLGGDLVVASPLYKQHFKLRDGACLEQQETRVRTWPVRVVGDTVEVLM